MCRLFLVGLVFCVFGCGIGLKDLETYAKEIAHLESSALEQVDSGIAIINKYCQCDDVYGVKQFSTSECQELAESVVITKSILEHNLKVMKFLGGMTRDVPPIEPPEIPPDTSLCPVLMSAPEELSQ